MYNFTSFAITLNELERGMEGVLAPTDCRLRPDIRAMENGKMGNVLLLILPESAHHCSSPDRAPAPPAGAVVEHTWKQPIPLVHWWDMKTIVAWPKYISFK